MATSPPQNGGPTEGLSGKQVPGLNKRISGMVAMTASPLAAGSMTKEPDLGSGKVPRQLTGGQRKSSSLENSPRVPGTRLSLHLSQQTSQNSTRTPTTLEAERAFSMSSEIQTAASNLPTPLDLDSEDLADDLDPPDCHPLSESDSEVEDGDEGDANSIHANGSEGYDADRADPKSNFSSGQESSNGVRRTISIDSMSNIENGPNRQQSWLALRNRIENGRVSSLRKDEASGSNATGSSLQHVSSGSGSMPHSISKAGSDHGTPTSNLAKALLSERAGVSSSPNSPRLQLSPLFGSGVSTPDGRRRMDPSKSFSRILEHDLFGTDEVQVIDRLKPCSLQLEDQQYILFGDLMKELAAAGVQRLVTVYVRHYLTEEAITEYKKSVVYMESTVEQKSPYHLLILGTCPPLFIPSFLSKAGIINVGRGPLPADYDSSKHISVLSDPEKELYAQLSAMKINNVITPTFTKAAHAFNQQQNQPGQPGQPAPTRSSGRLSANSSSLNLAGMKVGGGGSQSQSPTSMAASMLDKELPKQITETFKSTTRLSDPVSRGRGRLIPLFLMINVKRMEVEGFDMDINDKFKS